MGLSVAGLVALLSGVEVDERVARRSGASVRVLSHPTCGSVDRTLTLAGNPSALSSSRGTHLEAAP